MDSDTKSEIDAETAAAEQAKAEAEYASKPACEVCGHHPGDALHQCAPKLEQADTLDLTGRPDVLGFDPGIAPKPTILGPDGRPAGIEATETESLASPGVDYFVSLADKYLPDATPADKIMWARRMDQRHPVMAKAYRDGLDQGRDVRERAQRRLGQWWPSLSPLTPKERGFVVARVLETVTGVRN